ncbi:MAG: Rrf2 family transcriptional regulator [Planctomycetota bacterium]
MLNQATGYAATALGFLATAGDKPVLVKDIAEASGIPSPYLAKIINALARKGLLVTQRGIGGGVVLARSGDSITLHDLAMALDDTSILPRCMLGTAECSDERACPAHEFWTGMRGRYLDFLKRTTITDVAAFETRRRAGHTAPHSRGDTMLGTLLPISPPRP